VQVIADVDSTAPIDGRTLASLSLQGITGLLYIDLQQDKAATAAGTLPQGHDYPVIRSAPSDFDVLLSSLPALATHAIELVDHFNDVFTDENVRDIHVTLENTRLASEHLPATLHDVRDLVVDLRRATQEVRAAAAQLNAIAGGAGPDLKASVANVRRITDSLATTSANLDHFLADSEPGLSHFTQQGLPELEQLLRESRDAARDFRDLSRSLKRDPSQLLYESNYRGVEVAK
jgi:phospholipid/cholesterol/gamma-HCH transport system substrate-binding protein